MYEPKQVFMSEEKINYSEIPKSIILISKKLLCVKVPLSNNDINLHFMVLKQFTISRAEDITYCNLKEHKYSNR